MSIATRTGDSGTTALMYNRRLSKAHPRVEAYGCIDELNAAMGLARATADQEMVRQHLLSIQKDLVVLMGEVATANVDLQRYLKDGFTQVTTATTAKLDALVQELESRNISFRGWATPGASLHSAALDMARTICRRAERRLCILNDASELPNAEIMVYINRLSDVLWLLARWAEPSPPGADSQLV